MPNKKVVFSLLTLGTLVSLGALPALADAIAARVSTGDLDLAFAKFVLDNKLIMDLVGGSLLLALLTQGWKTPFPNKRRYFLLSALALTLLILPEVSKSGDVAPSTEAANSREIVRSRRALPQLSPIHIQEAVPAVHVPSHGCG
jgi:hypothetical protein